MGVLEDGKKVFVWGALPGETVRLEITKNRKDYAEAQVLEVIEPSPKRIDPVASQHISTAPWQIMDFDSENLAKKQIVREVFEREGVKLQDFQLVTDGKTQAYRNKIEFSFFGDDDGLHYAFYDRGMHRKRIVEGSFLALPSINTAAKSLLKTLNCLGVRAGDLKSVILRCDQSGIVVAALFVKPDTFVNVPLMEGIEGLKVYHSNPKSPASVSTKLLQEKGNCRLSDELLGVSLNYDVLGFFQVNLPVFEQALKRIDYFTGGCQNKVDMYGGVGSISIPIGGTKTIVELDEQNVAMAKVNKGMQKIDVIGASSEQALDYIQPDVCLIVDPPRSGLHKKVTQRITEVKPLQVCYLSCNPTTQARDISLLTDDYIIKSFEVYNFFPRTPHIETLAILTPIRHTQPG